MLTHLQNSITNNRGYKAGLFAVAMMGFAASASAQGLTVDAETNGKWLRDPARQCEGFVPEYTSRVIYKGGECVDGRINGRVNVELMRMPMGMLYYDGFFVDGIHVGDKGDVTGTVKTGANNAHYLTLGEVADARFYSRINPKVKDTNLCDGEVAVAVKSDVTEDAVRLLTRQATQAYYTMCLQHLSSSRLVTAVNISIVADDFLQQSPPVMLASATTQRVGNNWQIGEVTLRSGQQPMPAATSTEDIQSVAVAEADVTIDESAKPTTPDEQYQLSAAIFMDRMLLNGHPTCRLNVRVRNDSSISLDAVRVRATVRDNAGETLTEIDLGRTNEVFPKGSMTMAKFLPNRLCEYATRVDVQKVACTLNKREFANCAGIVTHTINPSSLGAVVADALPNVRVNF